MLQPKGLRRPGSRAEAAIFVALYALALVYVLAWPRLLGPADESHFLYHSREILAGKVLYRDLFEFYTPLSFYLMASAFAIFGTKLATAKVFIALIHAGTVGMIFLAARRAGARRSLAVSLAISFLAIGAPAWPVSSPHWIAAWLLAWLLFLLTKRPLERASLIWLGAVTGVLTSMQQQTGVPIAAGIGAGIVVEALLDARAGSSQSVRSILGRVCWFGVPAVGLTTLVLMVAMFFSGPMPMFEQLVIHPFTGYRSTVHTSWGHVAPMTSWLADLTYPRLLSLFAPALLVILFARLVVAWRTRERSAFGPVPVFACFLIFTIASVVYFPDFIHLAFVSPVFLILTAEAMEWGLRRVETFAPIPLLGLWVAIPVTALSLGDMLENNNLLHARYHIDQETRFGQVSFDSIEDQKLYLDLEEELSRNPDRMVFCYPACTLLYLMADAENPTRHVLMLPGYLPQAHFDEAIEALDTLSVRNVVIAVVLVNMESDPMIPYVRENYRCVDRVQPCRLYRRKERWR